MQLVCGKCNHRLEFSGDRPAFCSHCGQALTDTRADARAAYDPEAPTRLPSGGSVEEVSSVPGTLGGYRLVRELGSGGMGAVYEAQEIATGRRVALKIIGPEYAGSPEAVERFRQEGRLASMLSHSRCVFVLAVDEEAGRPYIVMELMPGSTLKDLVDRRGPLPPDEAIARILDVIEGLQEAHRLEIIHRDVKPANCFLDADGRVKVGDFGLAKSLVREAPHLTRTGAFLGTLFFASPEQVRGDALDPRTDVYSAAATLYYLLTGQAPFQSSDAAATLARIVSDPAPSVRSLRPDIAPALDRVVLRGLERDREQRWPDLEHFRQALLALSPPPLRRQDLISRLIACAFDFLLLWLVTQAIYMALSMLGNPEANVSANGWLAGLILFLGYFTVLEGLAGSSLGKGFNLRVGTLTGSEPPGWPAALLRTAIFSALIPAGLLVGAMLRLTLGPEINQTWVTTAWCAVGAVLVFAPMRAGNGYRGLHELLSGTRVFRPVVPETTRTLQGGGGWLLYFLGSRRLNQGSVPLSGIPERIGGFTIRGVLKWTAAEKILLGEDASLGRRVFLWLRPLTEPALDAARRDIGRRTRLRWLANGRQGDLQWDAILAPSGCPLPELVRSEGKLGWAELRPLLETLTSELVAANGEGTLPRSLSLDQVWVQPDGEAQLADTALTEGAGELQGATDSARGLGLLRKVVELALEGRGQASLPAAAREVVNRLGGVGQPFETVEQFQGELGAVTGRREGNEGRSGKGASAKRQAGA